MKTILVTGLDGSGKSTLLKKLAAQIQNKRTDILYLPNFDTESLHQTGDVQRTALFINKLNREADERQIPQLKGVALFAAMLLFRPILELNVNRALETLFCERHPLIDTGIYAKFYAEKLPPDSLGKSVIEEMDQRFHHELDYLMQLVPQTMLNQQTSQVATFMELIHRRFHLEKKTDLSSLQDLFGVGLPNSIYYLRADAAELIGRIRQRTLKEAHESEEVLHRLGKVYDELFSGLNDSSPDLVQVVDANNWHNLDLLFETLCREYE